MASGSGKKKSLREKFNDLAKKIIGVTALVGVVSTPVYYQYGTIREQDVVIEKQTNNAKWDPETRAFKGHYTLYTDKGTFVIAEAKFHGQSQADANDRHYRVYTGKNYHIKTYGVHVFGSWQPNIINAYELTEADLAAKKAAQDKMREKMSKKTEPEKEQGAAKALNAAAAAPAGNMQQPGLLSGEVVTYPVIVNGYSVQITVPVEVVGKVTVNTVRPVIAPPPPQ